jgi:hypothetical protein
MYLAHHQTPTGRRKVSAAVAFVAYCRTFTASTLLLFFSTFLPYSNSGPISRDAEGPPSGAEPTEQVHCCSSAASSGSGSGHQHLMPLICGCGCGIT